MKRFFFVLFFVALLLVMASPMTAQQTLPDSVGLRPDAPTYALHGPHWVGYTIHHLDDGNGRALDISTWYPALNPDNLDEAIEYTLPYLPPEMVTYGRAIADAAPDLDSAPYPLVILSHSGGTLHLNLAHFGEHLASYGFIVMAVEHEDNMASEGDDYTSFVSRPADFTRQIDYAEILTAEGNWAGLIDAESVSVIGHSFGGYAALAIAGGRMDWNSYLAWCEANADLDPMRTCQLYPPSLPDMAAMMGLDEVPEGLWPSMVDDRVKAIVPLAPAGRFIGSNGVQEITVPTLFVGGTGDSMTFPVANLYPIYDAMTAPKTEILFESAWHMFPVFTCESAPWVVDMGFYFVCADAVWDMERAQDLLHHFVAAFLLAEFYDDADAAAALAPEAVQFPGIIYETTEF